MKSALRFFFLSLSFLFILNASAQERQLTIEDAVLGYYRGLYPENLMMLQWVGDSNVFVYREDQDYIFKNTANQEVDKFSFDDLKKQYPDLERFPYPTSFTETDFVFQSGNAFNVYDYKNEKAKAKISYPENTENHDYCVKNNAVAYTIDNNLFVADTGHEKRVVTDFKDTNIVSGQTIHRSEFGITKGTFWSPKGNYLAFYQKDETNVTDYPLVDITTYPASLKNIKYPMAGQGSEQAKIGIYNLKTGLTSYLNIDTTDEHYLTNLAWSPDEKYILLAEVNRAQDHMWVNYYDIKTGNKVRTIFEEKNERWVEPETPALFLPESNTEFLWLSERDGFMNLYQYDLVSNKSKQITKFPFVLTEILGFGPKAKYVYVQATGNDPKELQVFKVKMSNGKWEQLTTKNGTHTAMLSHSGNYIIDNFMSLEVPRNINLFPTDEPVRKTNLLKAKDPMKGVHHGTTEFVQLKAVDGTPLEARIIKPADFDANKKYPVLVYVYGGPHAQLVNDTFLGGASFWMHYMAAEEGYIVFTVDGRGSANRGFEFESVIHREQGKVAMEDQMTGVNYLRSLPYVDADRMAIHGWSYGGFMTISMMLHHPEVFKVGVAGGPVTDWKYYEVMYGERYMDTPQENPEGYKSTRVHNYIKNLQGDLLIIIGSVDNVVVPQHSMSLLKEAVDNNVQVDFFTYPMHEHNVRGRDRIHLMEKVLGYIIDKNK